MLNTLLQGRPPLPPLPPSFCERFPDDPSCATNIPVDNGIIAVTIIGIILGILFIYVEKNQQMDR